MIDRFYIPSINSIYLKGLIPTISTLSVGLFRIKTQHILYDSLLRFLRLYLVTAKNAPKRPLLY
jgi:hypothetical protein